MGKSLKKIRMTAIVFLSLVLSLPAFAGQSEGRLLNASAKGVSKILTFPLELIRWPVDQTLVMTEKYHLDDKTLWFYNEMLRYGVTPYFNNVDLMTREIGVDVEWLRLSGLSARYPDASVTSWAHYAPDIIFSTGTKIKAERIHGTNFYVSPSVAYENRPEEHFYGIGPDASKGDGTSFRMESTALTLASGYQFTPFTSLELRFGYDHVNITNGEDGGRGEIDRIFPTGSIPGLAGDEMIRLEGEYTRDARDHGANSTKGSLERLYAGYYEGVAGSQAGFLKLAAEAEQFIQLGSEKRIFVWHALGEHRAELENKEVPFHQMASLGGYGATPRLSHTMRGYGFNRFFDDHLLLLNLEYRYSVWERDNMQLQTVVFFDEGQVFGEWEKMQFKDFRESYGGGFRFNVSHVNLLSLEIAHGDEGTEFYVKSNMPF